MSVLTSLSNPNCQSVRRNCGKHIWDENTQTSIIATAKDLYIATQTEKRGNSSSNICGWSSYFKSRYANQNQIFAEFLQMMNHFKSLM